MKISFFKRVTTVYKIIGNNFSFWVSPIFTGLLLLLLRVVVFIGRFFDVILFRYNKKIYKPIIIVGNPRSGTTFLQRFLVSNNLGSGTELWQMIYPSILLQKFFKPILPLLEKISPAKHHSTDAHKTSLTSVETDDVGIFFRYLDGFFLYGFFLCWTEDDLFNWIDPKIRDNSNRDFQWLESVWKRVLYVSKKDRLIAKLFSLSANLPVFLKKHNDAKILYLVREPIDVIPSGLSLVTGVLDKKFGFWKQPYHIRDRFIKRLYAGLVELLNRFCNDWNHGHIDKSKVYIVKYSRMMNDFENLMSEIVEFVECENSEELIKEIKLVSEKQSTYKSKHKYNLEKFNLNKEKIRKDCAAVYKTFNI